MATTYTVRFLNYAGDDLLGTVTVAEGGDASIGAPLPEIIEGKTFVSWNHDITCVKENMTVKGVYTDNYYSVNFYAFDNLTIISSQSIKYGGSATAPSPEEVEGYTFKKWDKSFTNVKSNLEVYPVYEIIVLTVRFYNQNKTELWATEKVNYGSDAIPPCPKVIERSIFIGWDTPYTQVKKNLSIKALYREVPVSPRLSIYEKSEEGGSGELIKTYRGVNACSITQKLDGECTIDFKLMTKQAEEYISISNRLEVEGLIFYITQIKKTISSGICYSEYSGEHISYILNDDEYKVYAFDMEGKPEEILGTLLAGTPFTIGQIDFEDEVTLRVNKEATRRACVMQLIALVGGEIEYYGYTIGIRKHMGSETAVDIMSSNLVQDISYSYNVSDQTTSYSLTLYQKSGLTLGDELWLDFEPLKIDEVSRIVGWTFNPFNYKEVSVTVGQYLPTINDSLYTISEEVQDVTQASAKYTIEFGEIIGNGYFYFTRAYKDRPYFQTQTDDGTSPMITLLRKEGSAFEEYVGAELSGVESTTVTVVAFYCTIPEEADDN